MLSNFILLPATTPVTQTNKVTVDDQNSNFDMVYSGEADVSAGEHGADADRPTIPKADAKTDSDSDPQSDSTNVSGGHEVAVIKPERERVQGISDHNTFLQKSSNLMDATSIQLDDGESNQLDSDLSEGEMPNTDPLMALTHQKLEGRAPEDLGANTKKTSNEVNVERHPEHSLKRARESFERDGQARKTGSKLWQNSVSGKLNFNPITEVQKTPSLYRGQITEQREGAASSGHLARKEIEIPITAHTNGSGATTGQTKLTSELQKDLDANTLNSLTNGVSGEQRKPENLKKNVSDSVTSRIQLFGEGFGAWRSRQSQAQEEISQRKPEPPISLGRTTDGRISLPNNSQSKLNEADDNNELVKTTLRQPSWIQGQKFSFAQLGGNVESSMTLPEGVSRRQSKVLKDSNSDSSKLEDSQERKILDKGRLSYAKGGDQRRNELFGNLSTLSQANLRFGVPQVEVHFGGLMKEEISPHINQNCKFELPEFNNSERGAQQAQKWNLMLEGQISFSNQKFHRFIISPVEDIAIIQKSLPKSSEIGYTQFDAKALKVGRADRNQIHIDSKIEKEWNELIKLNDIENSWSPRWKYLVKTGVLIGEAYVDLKLRDTKNGEEAPALNETQKNGYEGESRNREVSAQVSAGVGSSNFASEKNQEAKNQSYESDMSSRGQLTGFFNDVFRNSVRFSEISDVTFDVSKSLDAKSMDRGETFLPFGFENLNVVSNSINSFEGAPEKMHEPLDVGTSNEIHSVSVVNHATSNERISQKEGLIRQGRKVERYKMVTGSLPMGGVGNPQAARLNNLLEFRSVPMGNVGEPEMSFQFDKHNQAAVERRLERFDKFGTADQYQMPTVDTKRLMPAQLSALHVTSPSIQDDPNEFAVKLVEERKGRDVLEVGQTVEARHGPTPTTLQPLLSANRQDLPAAIFRQINEGLPRILQGSIEISLSPKELGTVRLQMKQSESGLVVHIQADRSETLDLLRRNIDQLARSLADMGEQASEFTFGDQDDGRKPPDSGGCSTSQQDDDLTTATTQTEQTRPNRDGLDIRL